MRGQTEVNEAGEYPDSNWTLRAAEAAEHLAQDCGPVALARSAE
jgi:hypothetical protein